MLDNDKALIIAEAVLERARHALRRQITYYLMTTYKSPNCRLCAVNFVIDNPMNMYTGCSSKCPLFMDVFEDCVGKIPVA